jgi:hypothetical protein
VSFSSSAETVTARCRLRSSGAQLQLPGGGAGAARALHQVLDLGGVFPREEVFEAGARAACSGGKICESARLTRLMEPSAAMEMTPVGMLSRMASVKRGGGRVRGWLPPVPQSCG